MKLRIVAALLVGGSLMASTEICEKKSVKEHICSFVKKHKYKIAAGVTSVLSVSASAYAIYKYKDSDVFSKIRDLFSKKSKNVENTVELKKEDKINTSNIIKNDTNDTNDVSKDKETLNNKEKNNREPDFSLLIMTSI